MRKHELFPSKYARGDDFRQPQIATILHVDFEQFPDKQQETAVVHFVQPGPKLLPLNLTNFMSIADIANSDETDHWEGVTIELYRDQVTVHGEVKSAVRVRPPSHRPQTQAAAAASQAPPRPSPADGGLFAEEPGNDVPRDPQGWPMTAQPPQQPPPQGIIPARQTRPRRVSLAQGFGARNSDPSSTNR
jgi:hypothetical protein